MATIQRRVKTYGTRSYVAEVAAAPGNEDPILASEVDADFDDIYAAWNGGADTVNIKDGSVTWAKLATDARIWSSVGATVTPTDATQTVVIPAAAAAAKNALMWGPTAARGRLVSPQVVSSGVVLTANYALNSAGTAWAEDDVTQPGWALFLHNADKLLVTRAGPNNAASATILALLNDGTLTLPSASSSIVISSASATTRLLVPGAITANSFYSAGWKQDDTSKAGWMMQINASADSAIIQRQAPGNGATASLLTLDSGGSLYITGPNGQKSTGSTWINPSDRRLKDEIEDYPTGLAAIVHLQPRTFVYNGKGGSPLGMRGYGFIADEMAPVMPETVGVRSGTLDPDDADETEIQTLDQSNLILALVNATKELADRVTALEAR